MKKKLFFAAVAIVALASCADNEFVGEVSPNPNPENGNESAIVFSSGTKALTRAGDKTGSDAATDLNSNFVFGGTKTESHTKVFDNYQANFKTGTAHQTESNSNNWEYVSYKNLPSGVGTNVGVTSYANSGSGVTQSIKYWDYATTQYDFAAYSLGIGATDNSSTTYATATAIDMTKIGSANTVYSLTGSVDELKACYISDLVTAYNRDGVSDYGNVVTFKFRSLATKIRLAFYETIPGYSVRDINFYSVAEGGTASTTPTLFTSSEVLPAGSGKMEITYPTTGFDKRPGGNSVDTDYNKAHVKFTPADNVSATSTLTFGAISNYATSAEGQIVANTSPYIGRASNDASYAGGIDATTSAGKYYTILPFEDGANLLLRINYTLVSTDGSGEEINVKNATAVVPAELAKWNPNYAYTYIFKISDMTNGSTGVDGSNKIVTGLTPITLDAVVVDSEDGVQETITTVSEPSITTYMAGKIITSNDEYKYVDATTPIYIIVNSGTSNQTLVVENDNINAELYTATIQSGAAQSISEESVDNALTNGAKDDETTPTTWTVTDINSQTLVVTKSDLLKASTQIEAKDSPTGNLITVPGAKFIPTNANTTYVFRYKTADVAEGYDAGTILTSGTSLKGYYTKLGTTYTACADNGEADGNTVYYRKTNAKAAGYQYKIIKVVANNN